MAKLANKKYGMALFQLAIETGKIDILFDETVALIELFKNEADLLKIITHPQVLPEEKITLLSNIFEGNLSDEMLGLFAIVVKKNREDDLNGILLHFLELVNKHNGHTVADVVSAVELSEVQVETIVKQLNKKLNKQVDVRTTVDSTLIAGLKISVDGLVIDGSVQKQIYDMKNRLLEIQLVQ